LVFDAGAQANFYQAGSSLQAVQPTAPAAQQLHQTAAAFGLQSFGSHSQVSPFLQVCVVTFLSFTRLVEVFVEVDSESRAATIRKVALR